MIKLEADKKNMEINKYEDEVEQMQKTYATYDERLKPLNVEYKKAAEIGERLSSITASKAKAEAE